MSESRKFSVHPHMIFNLITAQAGTLGKAVLENIMNSVDANATQVVIDITREGITLVDDGHGFRSIQEIEDCFEVFGFPHEEGARIYGRFGIGRAQMWAFSSAIWRTNTFVMDVDIKNRGLDYRLDENQTPVKGLTVESKFYTPMSTHDIQIFKQELKELALYAQIPVILNGEKINTDPTLVKWGFETDDAWIKITNASSLTVYNLGVLVKKYAAYQIGSGGLVVTKPGVRLSLNMARNDILIAECKVWGRIKPFIQKKSDDKVRRKTVRLTAEELENRALRFGGGELRYDEIASLKLITDIAGRGYTLEAFMSQDRGNGRERLVSIAENGSILGDRAHQTKAAFIVHPDVLTRFGAETLEDFGKILLETMAENFKDTIIHGIKQPPHWYYEFISSVKFENRLEDAVPSLKEGFDLVPEKEWTKKEKGVMHALDGIDYYVRNRILRTGGSDSLLKARKLGVGISETANAWTDAVAVITFNRKTLKAADEGYGGFMHLASLLAHEYLHDNSSTGTHIHDEMFYQRYHEVMNDSTMGTQAFSAYRTYISYLSRYGIVPSKKLLEALTLVENLDAKVVLAPEEQDLLSA